MDTFLNSLSDEQLGSFYAVQYDRDCDDKLLDILTAVQYKLYEKAKKEDDEQLLNTNHDMKQEIESPSEDQDNLVKENFLGSLSDEQLGEFFSVEHDADCDEKLLDILTKLQYDLYLKTKDEDFKFYDINTQDSDVTVYTKVMTTTLSDECSVSETVQKAEEISSSYACQNDLRILLLGEAGVGKSTMINAFANYMKYRSYNEAKKGNLEVLVSGSFVLMDEKMESKTFELKPRECEKPEPMDGYTSLTKYEISGGSVGHSISFIDTPGFGSDSDASELEFEQALSFATKQTGSYDAILVLLNPNMARLTQMLDIFLSKVLMSCSYQKLYFCFTNSQLTMYRFGESYSTLKKYLAKKSISTEDLAKRSFCFENDSFKFLRVMKEPNFQLEEFQTRGLEKSWNHSKETMMRLLHQIDSTVVQKKSSVSSIVVPLVPESDKCLMYTNSSYINLQEHVTTHSQPSDPLREEENHKDEVLNLLNRHDGLRKPVRERSKSRPRTDKNTSQYSHGTSMAVTEQKQKTTKCTSKEGSKQNDQKHSQRYERNVRNQPIQRISANYSRNKSSQDSKEEKQLEIEVADYYERKDVLEQLSRILFKDAMVKFFTRVDIKTDGTLVIINLTSSTENNIYIAIDYLWKRLRPFHRYHMSNFSKDYTDYWRCLTPKEQLDFQTKWQVAVNKNEDWSEVVISSFVSAKITIALTKLKEGSGKIRKIRCCNAFAIIPLTKDEEVVDQFSIELKYGEEIYVGSDLFGKNCVNVKKWDDDYETTTCITTNSGLITIRLKSISNVNIYRAQQHIWRQLRNFMKYEQLYNLTSNHAWNKYTVEERIKMQIKLQVSIEYDKKHRSRLLLCSFIEHKLDDAISKLDSQEGWLSPILSRLI